MANIEHAYSYLGHSTLSGSTGKQRLSLVSDRGDTQLRDNFLTAIARNPDITAKALRAISEIVGSRFYVPPSMLARILREADPVATVGAEMVRFEGFSACCSAYIRLDMDQGALDVSHRQTGTTNVDFGTELRAALAQVQPSSKMEITIGPKAVGIAHERASVVERKVPLPMRWIKGFANVQCHLSQMKPAFTLSRVAAQKFLRTLPRSKSDHQIWITVAGSSVRTTSRRTANSVPLRGGHRLRPLGTLVGKATRLQVYHNSMLGSSAWVLDFGTQRLVLVLNAEPWRGFSGDGGQLSDLAADIDTAAVRAQLNWQDRLELDTLAQATGLSPDDANRAMAHLAASGLIGFDLEQGAWFHRVLPFDLASVEALNPRLRAAHKLVESQAVTLCTGGADVQSDAALHRVQLNEEKYSCTCPWYAKNKATRGPCKHVLATQIVLEDAQ
jgi:hypothetical protein